MLISYTVIPTSGPYAGGNTVTITNYFTTITNVLLGGVQTTFLGGGGNWTKFVAPALGSSGAKNIIVQHAGGSQATLTGAYTVNPAGYIYDNASEGWVSAASLPVDLSRMGYATWSNSLYVLGGDRVGGVSVGTYRYDGGSSWTTCAAIPYQRYQPAVFGLGNYLYCAGGESNGWAQSSVHRFDGSSWTAVSSLPSARRDFASAVFNGQGYVIGGMDDTASHKDTVYRFDGTSWTTAAPLPAARDTAIAASLNGSLYVMGGMLDGGVQTTTILKFDGTSWTSAGNMPRWQYRAAVCVESNAIVVVGGMNTSYSAITNIIAFDGTNWTERRGLSSPLYFEAAGVVSNRLYVVGGGSTPSSETRYYRIGTTGVAPTSGDKAGGFTVTIMGTGLGNGSDITNVTLCGVVVSAINSQKATQVVVTAGTHPTGGNGDVRVYSTSQGMTVKSNYFTYDAPVLGLYYYEITNDFYYSIASQSAPSSALRTDFGSVQKGRTYTNQLVVAEDSYFFPINISTVQVTGVGAGAFGVSGVPASLVAGDYTNFLVRFTPPAVGVYTASVSFVNDGQLSPYIMYVAGTATDAVANITVLGTNGAAIASGTAASAANGSVFRPSALGTARTNTFSITNNGTGPLSISGYTTNGTDRASFSVAGMPATVAVGGAGNFTVTYRPMAVGSHIASLVISNNSPTTTYTVNFAGSYCQLSTNAGPYAGGNTITITNGSFGNVTNVLVGGVGAAIQASGANWVRITVPATGSGGAKDIVIRTSDNGDITLAGAYMVNLSVAVVAGLHGRVTPSGVVEVVYGGTMSFVAAADAYYHIASLSTNGANVAAASGVRIYTSIWANVTATGMLSAAFAENLAPLGTPEWWLAQYGWTNAFAAAETNDADGDGYTGGQEYVAVTDPTNKASFFRVESCSVVPPEWRVYVSSVSGRVYTLHFSSDLVANQWTNRVQQTAVPGTGGLLPFVETNGPDRGYYRIDVRCP